MSASTVPSKFHVLCFLIFILQFYGCNRTENKLFTLMPSSYTGITFANNISYNNRMNPYTNHGFYNGGGIAVGDINNDGLPDLFFCSNQGQTMAASFPTMVAQFLAMVASFLAMAAPFRAMVASFPTVAASFPAMAAPNYKN